MSSCPTAPTSTTASSTSSPSPADLRSESRAARTAVIACGALAQGVAEVAARRGWPLDVHPLPPLLHNQPQQIAGEVEALAARLVEDHDRVVIGYADCGTYGALDDVCERMGLSRLAGLHCYDVYGGAERLARWFEEQPGTYVLTDFLVRSFARTVLAELGLDRHPELRDAYFAHYTQAVWLAQHPDDDLRERAEAAAAALGLPLRTVEVGNAGLECSLAEILGETATDTRPERPAAA